MADRATLHLSKLDDFSEWMAGRGWTRVATKGAHEVLRLVHSDHDPLIFYARERAKEHATIQVHQWKPVRAYLRAKRLAAMDKEAASHE